MSRSGYSDDLDPRELNVWRRSVKAAIRGKRGQAFLREMVAALDAMPEKRLEQGVLVGEEGCCALGAVGLARGLDLSRVNEFDLAEVARVFGIATALVAEIAYENDEYWSGSPEARWWRMRTWAADLIASAQRAKGAPE